MDDFDKRLARFLSIGFVQSNTGISDGKYALTYSQMENLTVDEIEEFITHLTKVALKGYLKQDKEFTPYLDVIDDAIDSIEDINSYKLDKKYLDVSYVVLYKSIIDLDEVYQLCKNYEV